VKVTGIKDERSERPRRRAAEQGDEVAPSKLIELY
jgi:hypothetical protein